jgi:hypothetical protein
MKKTRSTSNILDKDIGNRKTPKPESPKVPKSASMSVADLLQFATGGIHAISPVSVQPRTEMWRWRLYQVKAHGVRSRHLVGLADGEGRGVFGHCAVGHQEFVCDDRVGDGCTCLWGLLDGMRMRTMCLLVGDPSMAVSR